MVKLTLELTEPMKDFIEAKAAERGFARPADFVIELVRSCQLREDVEQKLLAAVDSDQFEEVTPELWQRLRA